MTERLLTTRDLARQLGLTTETILNWVRNGELPAFRLPSGQIRFKEDELDQWLEARRATARRAVSPATPAAARNGTVSSLPSPATTEDEEA